MTPPTLVEMAQRAAQRYCKDIFDFGAIPPRLIKPIVAKIENPLQLKMIEEKDPELIDENKDKWMELIKRDVQDWERHFRKPPPGQSWWYTYNDIKQKSAEDAARSAESLKAELSELSAVREENIAEIRRGRPDPNTRKRLSKPTVSTWKKGPVFNPRKMKTPNHKLTGKSSAIVQAPPGFVDQIKRQQQVQARPTAPNPANVVRRTDQGPRAELTTTNKADLTERESRLRAAMTGQGVNTSRVSATEATRAPERPIIRPPTSLPSSASLTSRTAARSTPEKTQIDRQTSTTTPLKRPRIEGGENKTIERSKRRRAEEESGEGASNQNFKRSDGPATRHRRPDGGVDKPRQRGRSPEQAHQNTSNARQRHKEISPRDPTNVKNSASDDDLWNDVDPQRDGQNLIQQLPTSTTLTNKQPLENGVSRATQPSLSNIRRTASPLVNNSPRKKRPIAA